MQQSTPSDSQASASDGGGKAGEKAGEKAAANKGKNKQPDDDVIESMGEAPLKELGKKVTEKQSSKLVNLKDAGDGEKEEPDAGKANNNDKAPPGGNSKVTKQTRKPFTLVKGEKVAKEKNDDKEAIQGKGRKENDRKHESKVRIYLLTWLPKQIYFSF